MKHMIKRTIAGSFSALIIATTASGCSTAPVQTAYGLMPQYCTQNNTATGAIIGSLIGAGLGAAIGGGRGAAIGAASGLVLGGATGAHADQECQQVALQRAFEMAAAQEAAARQAAASQTQAQRQVVAYDNVEYVAPSNGQRHKIVPLKSYTNPVTKENCRGFDELTFGADDKTTISQSGHHVCQGADGKIHEA
jgi:uncharacterized protein YcfJ